MRKLFIVAASLLALWPLIGANAAFAASACSSYDTMSELLAREYAEISVRVATPPPPGPARTRRAHDQAAAPGAALRACPSWQAPVAGIRRCTLRVGPEAAAYSRRNKPERLV
jgi:hypothetical protein